MLHLLSCLASKHSSHNQKKINALFSLYLYVAHIYTQSCVNAAGCKGSTSTYRTIVYIMPDNSRPPLGNDLLLQKEGTG